MGYLLLTISAVLSLLAYRHWTKVLMLWARRRQRSSDLADIVMTDWPGLIGSILPRKVRRSWNALVLSLAVFMLGAPHHLVIWNFFRSGEASPMLYAHYL
jgi:hypothetical protein